MIAVALPSAKSFGPEPPPLSDQSEARDLAVREGVTAKVNRVVSVGFREHRRVAASADSNKRRPE
jgi:hypothetical protein